TLIIFNVLIAAPIGMLITVLNPVIQTIGTFQVKRNLPLVTLPECRRDICMINIDTFAIFRIDVLIWFIMRCITPHYFIVGRHFLPVYNKKKFVSTWTAYWDFKNFIRV